MGWRHYDDERASAFDEERAAPDEDLSEVRVVVVRELTGLPLRLVIDVGAGTGLWSDRLARWLGLPVIAVEPSGAMISVLREKRLRGIVAAQGRGEGLPLRDGCCGGAWLSTVVHHFEDLTKAAQEVARVLAPGGVALVRSSFPDQPSGEVYLARFFPSAARVVAEFPGLDEVNEAFGGVGLALRRRHTPKEVASPTRTAFLKRVERRADSLVREVSDSEFASGVRAMRTWVQNAPDTPVYFQSDLLVFSER